MEFNDGAHNICKELRECKINEVLEQKRRQQLRANSHELRQLERQLQSAVVYKQLREQQQDIVQRKEEELRKQRDENEKFTVECELLRKSIMLQEEQEKQKKVAFLGALKSQMSDLERKRQMEFEIVKKDSDEMEKLLNQIQAEEFVKRKEVQLLRERCKKEMEESYRNIKLKQQLEKERNDNDVERSLAYQKQCDNLKSEMAAKMKRIQKEKEGISERIGNQLATLNQEKEKRDNLLVSLLVEECKAKDDQRFRETLLKQINDREKYRIDIENFRQEIQIRKEREFKEEEENFRQENLRYLEERDKVDQLSDEKRRRKKLEHSKALKEMIETRRSQKAITIAAQIADFEKVLNDENNSKLLVEEERSRMLNAVPKELLTYLPPGVLRPSDKEFLILQGKNAHFNK